MFNPLVCFAEDRSREVIIDCFYSVPYLLVSFFVITTLSLYILYKGGIEVND